MDPPRVSDRSEDELEKHPPIGDDDPIPRVPRQRGWGFSRGQLMRIAMFAALLFAVIMLRKPCAEGVGSFVDSFEPPIDAGAAEQQTTAPPPPQLEKGEYIRLEADDDPETIEKKIRQIRGEEPLETDEE